MAKIYEYLNKHCPKCDKDVQFEIRTMYVEYNGFITCLKCPSCSTKIPYYSFDEFLKDGIVRIAV